MKKFFTLIAGIFVAGAVMAQDATITFEEATSSTGTFGSGDFTITTAGWDGTLSNTSTRYFGTADSYASCTGMVRAGNKVDGSTRSLKINSTYGGSVTFYMCTSSSTVERDVTVNGTTKSTASVTAADNAERKVYNILTFDITYGETPVTTSGDVYIYKVEFTSNGTQAPAEKPTLLTYTLDATSPTTATAEGWESDGEWALTKTFDNGSFTIGNYSKVLVGEALTAKASQFTQDAGFLFDGGTNSTKYVAVTLNTKFQAGDQIQIVGFRSGSSAEIGVALYDSKEGTNLVAELPYATARYADNTVNYEVAEGDNLVGKNTLYLFRIGSGSCYFHGITIKGDTEGREQATAVEAIAENAPAVAKAVKVIKNGKLYIGNYNVAGQQVK